MTILYIEGGNNMKTKLKCQECGNKFSKTIKAGTYEIKCPKCKSYDVDVADYYQVKYGEVKNG